MRKSLRVFCTVLALVLAFSVCDRIIVSAAPGLSELVVQSLDEMPPGNGVSVLTYGSFEPADNTIAAVVDSGCAVVSVGKEAAAVPDGGFIIVADGTRRTMLIRFAKEGDTVVFDKYGMRVVKIDESFGRMYTADIGFDGVNTVRSDNTIIIYRDKYSTGTNIWGVEAVVDADGRVISVGGNDSIIPQGGFVISAVGDKREQLRDVCRVGMLAVIDENKGIVDLVYDVSAEISRMETMLNERSAEFQLAKREYRIFDEETALSLLGELERTLNAAQNAGSEKSVFARKLEFESLCSALDNSMTESPAVEMRALWLRPTDKTRESVAQTVASIAQMGFNTICIEILYDNTVIMPMPEDSLLEQNPLFDGFDVLKAYCDECRGRGIELHAWMSVYRVGHDASGNPSAGVAVKKPEWRIISKDGADYVENEFGRSHFLNPALPEVKEFLLSVYEYILTTYPINGLQLDYIRYPENSGNDYGYDEYTCSLYIAQTGVDPMTVSKGDSNWSDWCAFRAGFVTEMVRSVSELVDRVRPDVYLTCDVRPDFDNAPTAAMQDTETWVNEGLIDGIFPMAYGEDAAERYTGSAVAAAGDGSFVVVGLSDYGIGIFKEQILQTREGGADGVAFFSYSQYISGGYAEPISENLFAAASLSPTYDARRAAAAQLSHAAKRLEVIMASGGFGDAGELSAALSQSSLALADTLSDRTLSQCENDFGKLRETVGLLLAELESAGSAYRAVKEDYRKVFRIFDMSRDVEKASYFADDMIIVSGIESCDDTEPASGHTAVLIAAVIAGVLAAFAGAVLYRRKHAGSHGTAK